MTITDAPKIITSRLADDDSHTIERYEATGGYRALRRALGMTPQQLVDEVTREPVDSADKGRGYEIDKGTFIPVDDEEVEALQVESTHTVEIDSFVPAAQIDKRYYDSPYYVFPNDSVGQEAFAVIRDAMKGKGVVALGRIVLNKRERVIALEPFDKGLLGTTLHYPYEMRSAADYFDDIADVTRRVLERRS